MAGTDTDDLTTDHGCLMTAKWDWTTSNGTGRWTNPQQAIKARRMRIPTSASDPRNDGHGVLKSRLKVRGKGESLTIRFDSETGKDFQIFGWTVPFEAETTD